MILSELQHYLAAQQKVSLAEMETRFQMDAAALRGMLHHLVRKGRVRQLPLGDRCPGCCQCKQESLELYEWIQVPGL